MRQPLRIAVLMSLLGCGVPLAEVPGAHIGIRVERGNGYQASEQERIVLEILQDETGKCAPIAGELVATIDGVKMEIVRNTGQGLTTGCVPARFELTDVSTIEPHDTRRRAD